MFDQMFLGSMDNNKKKGDQMKRVQKKLGLSMTLRITLIYKQCIGTMILVLIENFKLWAMDYKKRLDLCMGD